MSLHIWSVLAKDISDMTSDDEHQHLHKEEPKARMTADATDRSKIRHKLQESIDPLDSSTHSDGNIVQSVSGKRANDPTVNIHEAVAVGTDMVKLYESTWSGGFHDTLPKKVRTTAITKKHIQVGSAKVYDTNLIYSRIIGLQASGREMNLKEVLKYELSPIPTSMFTTNGEMRLATSKSTLKNKLKVEITGRYAPKPTSVIIGGSAILWVVHWPTQRTVQYLVGNVVSYVMGKMKDADVYLIFDRHEDYSIKESSASKKSLAQHGGRKQAHTINCYSR